MPKLYDNLTWLANLSAWAVPTLPGLSLKVHGSVKLQLPGETVLWQYRERFLHGLLKTGIVKSVDVEQV